MPNIQCPNCNGERWVKPELLPVDKIDEIDRAVIRAVGEANVRKICPICHGHGRIELEHERFD